MEFWYLLIFIIIILFFTDYYLNKDKTKINAMTGFLVVFLCFLSAIRGRDFKDQVNYREFFDTIPSLTNLLFGSGELIRLEPIYQLFISIFKIFSTDYNLFLLAQTILIFAILIGAAKRVGAPINATIVVYFFLLYLSNYVQQRMAIVYVLSIFAITCVIRKELKQFLFVVMMATGVHYMAFLLLPSFWLPKLFLTTKRIGLVKLKRSYHQYNDGDAPETGFTAYKAGWLPMQFLTPFTIVKIGLLTVAAIFITLKFDLIGSVYGFISGDSITHNSNIILYKFTSYYGKLEGETSITNAWLGVTSTIIILLYTFHFRQKNSSGVNGVLFAFFGAGLLGFILVYNFSWLSDRLFRMYAISALVLIFSFMLATKQKHSILTIPVIFSYCIYKFLSNVSSETGPYHIMEIF